jgi:hypothetical protein
MQTLLKYLVEWSCSSCLQINKLIGGKWRNLIG